MLGNVVLKNYAKRGFRRVVIAHYCDFLQITSGELRKSGIFVFAVSCVAWLLSLDSRSAV